MDIADCLGQRVLVSINDEPPRMTCVAAFAPSGQYVWLHRLQPFDEEVGWRHVAYVRVLEVFGESTVTLDQFVNALLPEPVAAPVAAPALAPALQPAAAPST